MRVYKMIRVDSFHNLVSKCAYKCHSQRRKFIRSKSLELLNADRHSLLTECKRSKLQFQIWRFPVTKNPCIRLSDRPSDQAVPNPVKNIYELCS